jgi:hypothetical protein
MFDFQVSQTSVDVQRTSLHYVPIELTLLNFRYILSWNVCNFVVLAQIKKIQGHVWRIVLV